jgi:outer membrane protein assembly factor BamB
MKRILSLILVAWLWAPVMLRAENWIHWRGPTQNGVSADTDLPSKWSRDPMAADNNLIWKMPYGGRSTPLVLNGRVYIIDDAGEGVNEQERVVCFDADTGKCLWEYRFNVFLTDIVSSRVGWANLAGDAETGNIYAHGVQGLLYCFDKDGKVLWSHSLTEEYGRISGYGGRVNSPIVDGDLVIMGMVNASWGDQTASGNRFLALDKRTGTPVWWSQPTTNLRGTYSSVPVVAVINGQRLLITGTSGGEVVAMQIGTGKPAWSYTVSAKSINISPVVNGTRVYIAHGEENTDTTEQGRVVCVDAGAIQDGKPKLVWKVDGITVKAVSPIFHDGRLYVCDDAARMFCMNGDTGEIIWKFKYGNASNGSPVLADGKIYVAEVKGKFHILKPGPKKCEELHWQYFRSPDGTTSVELNGSPAIANGRIYFTTTDEIYCIGKPGSKKLPPIGSASPVTITSGQPAQLLVFPADVALGPGESTEFKVRAYDVNGVFLREVKADSWSLPAPPPPMGSTASPPPLAGTITPEGKLTVAKAPPGQFGTVLAKVGNLTARARVRVMPPLPLHQDFKNVPEGRTPAGWVNAPVKFAVVVMDGTKVLKKNAKVANPLVARAYAYFSKPTLADYTVQADLMGEKKQSDMPDMGLLNSRYSLVLDGNKQRLRIMSWEALPRVDKHIPWEWKPDVWYTMKLSVAVQGSKAVVRGKVWPRGDKEPAAWTTEFEDPTPNHEGSPGLYGYATGILEDQEGAAMYYANVSVTPNKQ